MSRRAATTTTSTWGLAPSSAGTPPTTWCSSTAWSSGIGICSWAWKRTAASISFGILDRGQAQRADDDPLVADPEPDPLGELVLGEERLQRGGDAVGVEHLALVEGAGRQAARSPQRALPAAEPLRWTSAAATLPASMSRPTTAALLLLPGQLQHAPLQSTERPQNFRPASTYF